MGLAKAIRQTNREIYDVTSACEGTVLAAAQRSNQSSSTKSRTLSSGDSSGGSALDWFYHELHTTFAYQIKLRDRGSYGFLVPSEYIVPTGKEIFNAVVVFGNFLLGDRTATDSDQSEDENKHSDGEASPDGSRLMFFKSNPLQPSFQEKSESDPDAAFDSFELDDAEEERVWQLRRRRRK